jgi:hypothetical protein
VRAPIGSEYHDFRFLKSPTATASTSTSTSAIGLLGSVVIVFHTLLLQVVIRSGKNRYDKEYKKKNENISSTKEG